MRHMAGGTSFRARQGFTLPAVANNYANDTITMGVDSNGRLTNESFSEISVLVESSGDGPAAPVAFSVELWIPSAGTSDDAGRTSSDYTLAGSNFAAITAVGLTKWSVGRLPGAQIRVKPTAANPGGLVQYVSVWAG